MTHFLTYSFHSVFSLPEPIFADGGVLISIMKASPSSLRFL